ncbi:hypothetical protein LTR67_011093 [Exophiala xenobiotica]
MPNCDSDLGDTNIFVVSNRLPVSVKLLDDGTYDFKVSSGGLVGALHGLSQSVKFKWYGWPGQVVPDRERQVVKDELVKHKAVPVFLEKELAEKHYNGFSNKILWPLLHYQINEIYISQADWQAYQDVNSIFADSLADNISDGDLVWVQDYHLCLLPSLLRQKVKAMGKKNVKIGFFLHTVFPASDFFRILPVRKNILGGLLHCDIIGFHNPDYAAHFLNSCYKIMGLDVTDSQVNYDGRAVQVVTNPIGIEPSDFHTVLQRPQVQSRIRSLRESYRDKKVLISVDRLDYIKGIPLRLEAMDALLTQHPDLIGKVVLLQILIPSREDVEGYQRLHSSISERVSRINEKFGKIEFNSIHSMFNSVSREELAALYATADACVISSTRDGLNVVSLEYIACQREDPGVLLLSEFAGSAEFLNDAVKFNPWDTMGFAHSIYDALTMDQDERSRRFKGLNRYVTGHTRY